AHVYPADVARLDLEGLPVRQQPGETVVADGLGPRRGGVVVRLRQPRHAKLAVEPIELGADDHLARHSAHGGRPAITREGERHPYPSAACFSSASRSSSARLFFSAAVLSWPQAASMSRPRGVRTGAEMPASNTISEKRLIRSGVEHS